MKKGWKIFLIICLSLVGVGVICCIAGLALGATTSGLAAAMNKTGLVSWPTEVVRRTVRESDDYDYDDNSDDLAFESQGEKQKFDNVRSISADIKGGILEILPSDDDSIYVEEGQGSNYFRADMEDEGELEIEATREVFGSDRGKWVRIYIPADYQLQEAGLNVDAGQLVIEDITASELSVDVGAGEGIIKNFTADSIDIDCGAGKVEVTGDARRKIEIDCGMGEVTAALREDLSEYSYSVQCGIGEVRVGDTSYSGIGREHTKYNDGASRSMDIECGIGSVTVK